MAGRMSPDVRPRRSRWRQPWTVDPALGNSSSSALLGRVGSWAAPKFSRRPEPEVGEISSTPVGFPARPRIENRHNFQDSDNAPFARNFARRAK